MNKWIKLIKASDYDKWLDQQAEEYMSLSKWRNKNFSGELDWDVEFEDDFLGAELLKDLDPNVTYLSFSIPFYYNFNSDNGASESDIEFEPKEIKNYENIYYKDENGSKVSQEQFKQWYKKNFDAICDTELDLIVDYLNTNYDELTEYEPDYDDIGD